MVTVCAWCEKYMGSREPLHDTNVSHGICEACLERQPLAEPPVIVVSRERAHTVPLLRTLLRGAPEVAIVVDRRDGDRRNGGGRADAAAFDRRAGDRRQPASLYVL
jgi:hypothetical protein